MYIDENRVLFSPLFFFFLYILFCAAIFPLIALWVRGESGGVAVFFLLFFPFFVQLPALISLPGHLCARENI